MTRDEIVAELTRAEAWKVRAGCASAAERAAPLFRKFGRPESMPTFEAGLAAAWAAVTSRGGSATAGSDSASDPSRRAPSRGRGSCSGG